MTDEKKYSNENDNLIDDKSENLEFSYSEHNNTRTNTTLYRHYKKRQKRNQIIIAILSVLIVILALALIFSLIKNKKSSGQFQSSQINSVQTINNKSKDHNTSIESEEFKQSNSIEQQAINSDSDPSTTIVKNHNAIASKYAWDTAKIRAVSRGEDKIPDKKLVFLTIDDGVTLTHTPLVLDTLKELGVPATMYVIGRTVNMEHKPLFERFIKEGHSIGIHSFTHEYKELYPKGIADPNEILNQLIKTREAFKKVMGDKLVINTWRYPGGHLSWYNMKPADEALRSQGVEWLDWNCLVGDAEPKSRRPTNSEEMMNFFIDSLKYCPNKDCLVILMHDTPAKEITRQTLPQLVKWLKDNGYEFGVLQ